MPTQMRWFRIALGVVALVGAGAALAFTLYFRGIYRGNAEMPPPVFIVGGTLFAGVDTSTMPNPGILLEGGSIGCIGAACDPGNDALRIDASGRAILPGLFDLHVHFFSFTAESRAMSTPAMIWNYARLRPDIRRNMLAAGITTIRSVGDPDIVFDLRSMMAEGDLGGPRMQIAGPLITAPGGHPTQVIAGQTFGSSMVFESDDPEEIGRHVEALAERGVAGIKLVLQQAVSDAGEVVVPSLSAASYAAAVVAARAHGLWVATHVGSEREVQQAVRGGTTTIEHGVRHGNRIGRDTLELLAATEVVYVPTLQVDPMGALNVPALHEAGVALGVGTDTNRPTMRFGASYHGELARLVDAGLPPAEALLAATRNGARALELQDGLGTIEAGKTADVIIVDGEPWNDIGDLENVETVIQAGHIVVQPE